MRSERAAAGDESVAGRAHDLERVSKLVSGMERRVGLLLGIHEASEMLCYVLTQFPQAKIVNLLSAQVSLSFFCTI